MKRNDIMCEVSFGYLPKGYNSLVEYSPKVMTTKEGFLQAFREELRLPEFVTVKLFVCKRVRFGEYEKCEFWRWAKFGVFPHGEVMAYFSSLNPKTGIKLKITTNGFWAGGDVSTF